MHILDSISLLKPQERLLLYMRMPSGAPDSGDLADGWGACGGERRGVSNDMY